MTFPIFIVTCYAVLMAFCCTLGVIFNPKEEKFSRDLALYLIVLAICFK